eukprot:g31890.t1
MTISNASYLYINISNQSSTTTKPASQCCLVRTFCTLYFLLQLAMYAEIKGQSPPVRLYWQLHPPSAPRPDGAGPARILAMMGFQTEGVLGWAEQVRHFTGLGYEVVTFDNRGCGRSSSPVARYTTSMMADDALELLTKHVRWTCPRQLHLISVSMGGMIALELMSRLLEGKYDRFLACDDQRCMCKLGVDEVAARRRFRSCALLVTQATGWRRLSGLPALSRASLLDYIRSRDPRRSSKSKMYKGLEQAFSKDWLQADSGTTHPETGAKLTNAQVVARRGAKLHHAKRKEGVPNPEGTLAGMVAQLLALATHHVSNTRLAALREVGLPLLVVGADSDRLVQHISHRLLAKKLAPFEYLHIEAGSHAVPVQHARETNAALERLFAAAERAEQAERAERTQRALSAKQAIRTMAVGQLGPGAVVEDIGVREGSASVVDVQAVGLRWLAMDAACPSEDPAVRTAPALQLGRPTRLGTSTSAEFAHQGDQRQLSTAKGDR